jgi:hypothetical protein
LVRPYRLRNRQFDDRTICKTAAIFAETVATSVMISAI